MLGGNPSRPSVGITLENWQTAPQLHWSFQHIEELFPTAAISRGAGPVAPLPDQPSALDDILVGQFDGTTITVGQVMDATDTDGWIVVRDGTPLPSGTSGAWMPTPGTCSCR